ncbi:type VI secretion system baseplate subunit TssG [Shewanella oncorhynchi]|uniref:type VI secretion system baseplate subunit TssG n=1 Tax=Shewanella oncorhynchi TaxID=2726434 RepID=UPI002E7AFADD|nr:type VI secretion system baseplate subunit TssG [Shewanella oncorhynchi]WVI95195.1 type VI secretion system baseplate subunit TssG [Shewanella oncorhynchi]
MSIRDWKDSPESFDFYQAVYFLQKQLSSQELHWHSVGRDAFPEQELIRFKSVQHLGFPGQAISKVESKDYDSADKQAFNIHVSFMGLTGPSGVMPQHYSELMLQRLKLKDRTMRDFFDIFNHRLISLYYRAWEKHQFACHYGSQQFSQDPFSQVVLKLVGSASNLNSYYAGAFVAKNRGAQFLKQILTDFLGAEIEIKSLQGHWISLNASECSYLASGVKPEGVNAELGKSMMLGQKVWDVSSIIDINIKATSEVLRKLLPSQSLNLLVQKLVKEYLAPQVKARVTLVGRYIDFPTVRLGAGSNQLGQVGRLSIRNHKLEEVNRVGFKLARS